MERSQMSFQINTNIASLQSQQYLRVNSEFQSKTINRVTSGLRIISSGDDAAGLAVANSFRSDQSCADARYPQRQRRPVHIADHRWWYEQHLSIAGSRPHPGDPVGVAD